MPDKVDILEADGFYTNADFLVKFAVKKTDGTAQPITNWALSWLMKARTKDADASAVVAKTTAAGITITDGANGLCQVSIADTDTVSVKANVYVRLPRIASAAVFASLQSLQSGCTLDSTSRPPSASGMMWSRITASDWSPFALQARQNGSWVKSLSRKASSRRPLIRGRCCASCQARSWLWSGQWPDLC